MTLTLRQQETGSKIIQNTKMKKYSHIYFYTVRIYIINMSLPFQSKLSRNVHKHKTFVKYYSFSLSLFLPPPPLSLSF
uniref:Uncharacterized protein n=1 Tax=Octopus bimaculoides TaxID=37653 RepID=A0A0L8IAL9_OCTBM